MKYRTIIKLIADAEDENEAIDIAGEFLRGNLESGVEMKCKTKPLKFPVWFRASIALVLISLFFGIASFSYFKSNATPPLPVVDRISAFQPPLKTSQIVGFKEAWKEEENETVLNSITE